MMRLLGEKRVKRRQAQRLKNMEQDKKIKRNRRRIRIRNRITGTAKIPRLCVFRSNKHIYGQLIDDEKRKTLLAVNDKELKKSSGKKVELANQAGQLLAKKALEKKIEKVVFDRSGYKYHGRIKAMAEGARQGGLKF